jgi:catechol 2,3-dioxygenase-like lactoylglutathione lyase family enzyme
MSFRVVGTNHTSFTVSSLDRTLPFFIECLKFKLVSRAPRDPQIVERVTGVPGADMEIAFVSGHGHTVELIEYKAPASKGKVQARPCDTGFAHLAFNVDDVDGAVSAAAGYGVTAVSAPVAINAGPNRGRKVVYCRDGDGVTFEFIEVRTT